MNQIDNGEERVPPHFIQKTIVVNLDERLDRLSEVARELNSIGVEFERFSAIKHETGWKGYNASMLAILEENQEVESLFLVEDDCQFLDCSHLREAIEELPKDWDGLWLGSNLQALHSQRTSSHLYRLEHGWSTHAVVLTKKFRKWCLERWDREMIFDEFLRVTAQPLNKCYVVFPMVAIQRPSYSDIRNDHMDYTETFKQASKKFI